MTSPEVPLIKDSVAELSPETHPDDPRKSWILAAQHRPRGNRPSRSSRSGNGGALTIPSEIVPVENRSQFSYAAESSFMFSRRARALRTYFREQLDGCQFLTPFSNRSFSIETMNLNPTPVPNLPPLPTSIDATRSDDAPLLHNITSSSYTQDNAGLQLLALCDMWQRACRTAIDVWELAKESSYASAVRPSIRTVSHYLESILLARDATAEPPTTSMTHPKETSTAPGQGSRLSAQTQKSPTVPNDQTTDAAGRHTPELRGSCMAVVIGLVAGIMWF